MQLNRGLSLVQQMDNWLAAPFNQSLPWWKIALYALGFAILAYAVWDIGRDI
jgi:hypothetical protein